MLSTPSILPELFSQWIQPGAVVAIAGLLLIAFRGIRADLKDIRIEFKEEIRANEARQERQMDEFKQEIRANEARQERQMNEFKQEVRANEARQEKQMDELKQANKALGEKVDRLLEAFLMAQAKE